MKKIDVATTETEVFAGGNVPFIGLHNNSSEVMYLKFDGSSIALTVDNGIPLQPTEKMILANDGFKSVFINPIVAIHGGSGTKDLRVQGDE